jgi:hypothetical protein
MPPVKRQASLHRFAPSGLQDAGPRRTYRVEFGFLLTTPSCVRAGDASAADKYSMRFTLVMPCRRGVVNEASHHDGALPGIQ